MGALFGFSQQWASKNVPKSYCRKGTYSPAGVVKWYIGELKKKHPSEFAKHNERSSDVDILEISRRKKLADAQNAEEQLALNRLKTARLRGELMRIDNVKRIIEAAAYELRKPIEIIGRNHPELQQLILNGLDNARDSMAKMFADDQLDL